MAKMQKTIFVQAIAETLQKIAYTYNEDFLKAYVEAWEKEQSLVAKNALGEVLQNATVAFLKKRPMCQDTGMVLVFAEIGMDIVWDSSETLEEMIDEAVKRAYTGYPNNLLRASVVKEPFNKRINTVDNTPANVHIKLVKGKKLKIKIAAKGGGSEAKARLLMLNPSDNIAEKIAEVIKTLGGGWCPPGVLGVGIGGSAEKAMLLAKEALFLDDSISELKKRGAKTALEKLRLKIYETVNKTGIGAQGLGGMTTVLDVKILDFPTHAANLPVAIAPNCAADRHAEIEFDIETNSYKSSALAENTLTLLKEKNFNNFKNILNRKVNLDNLTKDGIASWQIGEKVLLSGTILTGRDLAHKRLSEMRKKGEKLPEGLDFKNKFIYYVGPIKAVSGEIIGPAGPTTASRMDCFTELMLGDFGLLGMIGKGERSKSTIECIKKHGAVYLIGIGGAACIASMAIKKIKTVAFQELGMEAIYELTVEDMPFIVAIDSKGNVLHK